MIQIKPNDYVQPTEVREEVVQAICEAFLKDEGNDRFFHPYKRGTRALATLYVAKPKQPELGDEWGFKNEDEVSRADVTFRIRGCEMKRAFYELRDAGYFIFRIWMFGTWKAYMCAKKPSLAWNECNPQLVESFDDFID